MRQTLHLGASTGTPEEPQTLVVVTVAFIGICSVFVMIIIISEQILTLLIKSCYSYHSANVQLMRYEKIAY